MHGWSLRCSCGIGGVILAPCDLQEVLNRAPRGDTTKHAQAVIEQNSSQNIFFEKNNSKTFFETFFRKTIWQNVFEMKNIGRGNRERDDSKNDVWPENSGYQEASR